MHEDDPMPDIKVKPITCQICGSTDSILWYSFLHNPVAKFTPIGVCYTGQRFHLCDRCMAEMIDTALDIRKKIALSTVKSDMDDYFKTLMDTVDKDVSDAAKNNDPPSFHHSMVKPKEDTEDEM